MKQKLQIAILKLLSLVPRTLPVGMTEFHQWADRILLQAGAFADADSMKFALASQVIHLGPQVMMKPDLYFVASLRKAAANQVASQVFQDIKIKQQEAINAAKKAAEVTATPAVTSNEQK